MEERKQKPLLEVLIVEDNYDDMEYISSLLQEIEPTLILHKTGNATKALEITYEKSFDLFLLDVELPDMDGFSLAGRIRDMEGHGLTPIVFVTASDADPLSAHKNYHCYDYIKKPFLQKDFNEIIGSLLTGIYQQKKSKQAQVQKKEKVILLETRNEMHLIKFDDILFAETNNRIITIYLTKNRSVTGIRMRFEDFIQYINSPDFIRCHKSYAVNVQNIYKISKIDYRSSDILFKDTDFSIEKRCIMSRTYQNDIMSAIHGGED